MPTRTLVVLTISTWLLSGLACGLTPDHVTGGQGPGDGESGVSPGGESDGSQNDADAPASAGPSRQLPSEWDASVEQILAGLDVRADGQEFVQFQVIDTMEVPDAFGRPIQYHHRRSGSLARPNRVQLSVKGDLYDVVLWSDGETVTVLDQRTNSYWHQPAQATLGQILEQLDPGLGFDAPVNHLAAPQVARSLLRDVVTTAYLGLATVGESACHHLLLSTPDEDRQIWVEKGDKQRTMMLVVTRYGAPGRSNYTLRLQIATNPPMLPDTIFEFRAPEGSHEVPAPGTDTAASDDAGAEDAEGASGMENVDGESGAASEVVDDEG